MCERDLVHSHRKREIVWRILEERIAADVDFMEVDARRERRQPERHRVADEVDLVAASREGDAELGREGAGAAVGRITGDADLHAAAQSVTSCFQLGESGSTRVTDSAGS